MDPKRLRKLYMQALPKLNKALEHIKSQLKDASPDDFQFDGNTKPYASIKRKMLAKQLSEPTELPDLVRGKLFYSERFEPKEVIEIVKTLFPGGVKHAHRRPNHEETGLSFPDQNEVVLDIDGQMFELLLIPMHQIQEQLQDPNGKLTEVQKNFLRKTHNRLFVNPKSPKQD
jgi:hypothetical protein